MPKTYHVYILTNRTRSTLYIGMTGNLPQRMEQHATHEVEGFTSKYNVDRLVHCEEFDNPMDAIKREKQLKAWKRAWKDELIDAANPTWRDLNKV